MSECKIGISIKIVQLISAYVSVFET